MDWGVTTMRDLRRLARPHSDMTSVFEWLKAVGLVHQSVTRMPIRQVVELDPECIDVKYLASAAYEWDSWGPTGPDDFIKALSAECKGAKRDLILETLMALGRQMEEAAA